MMENPINQAIQFACLKHFGTSRCPQNEVPKSKHPFCCLPLHTSPADFSLRISSQDPSKAPSYWLFQFLKHAWTCLASGLSSWCLGQKHAFFPHPLCTWNMLTLPVGCRLNFSTKRDPSWSPSTHLRSGLGASLVNSDSLGCSPGKRRCKLRHHHSKLKQPHVH